MTEPSDVPWRRLDPRLIWADGLRVVLSMLPGGFAILFLDARGSMTIMPLVGLAAWGVWGALGDLVRWLTTRYRVTESHVERRSGVLVRSHRSISRERIRTVDADARLIHRLAGVRRLTIGAGQTSTTTEAALTLDAVSKKAAHQLRAELTGVPAEEREEARPPAMAEFDWRWIIHNLFGVWALLTAAGLLWGGFFTLGAFGVDVGGWVSSLADWDAQGPVRTALVAWAAVVLVGAAGMGGAFLTGQAHFRLTREPGEQGEVLRTSRGLFRTREVVRDESRVRGVSLSEPLLWRWLGTTDTSLITTGVFWWSEGVAILPRGPRRVARRVAAEVLRADPLAQPLVRHPVAALRRRLTWALLTTAGCVSAVAPLGQRVWLPVLLVLGPLSVGLACAGYRALGHSVRGDYLVFRSGALSRVTSVLRHSAVSGVSIRQSPLQRRLGLATVRVSTAAGDGVYQAVDLAMADAVPLAAEALSQVKPFRRGGGDIEAHIGSQQLVP
ncbi:PH domain-containing protein [Streptomyces profundus]|uniref:PH domain-containing protein n=1 Tax=Streptomyces profundus TaxID=2867410 RepID=UPI001D16C1B0|nr:PH domain-containing protein [Streptomyces sp. MA3_2.13]UED84417.1 PH domain-containing protein [Streptomyces sp. MA3_2.13]